MPLVVCHTCWFWVEPRGGLCPECQRLVPLSEPDPALDELLQRLGRAQHTVAPVQFVRRELSDIGHLFVTTTGLLFLPAMLPDHPYRITMVRSPSTGSPWGRWLPGRRQAASPESMSSWVPPRLDQLAEDFMHRPGALFLPARGIREVSWRTHEIRIERLSSRVLRFLTGEPLVPLQVIRQQVAEIPEWHARIV